MKSRLCISVAVTLFLFVTGASAQNAAGKTKITEPLGGRPAAGAKPYVQDLDYQVTYQRAFEAVIWSMPAVGIYGFYRAAMNIGAKDNTVFAWSQPAKPNAELLTANNQAPYILSRTDLRQGPVVVDVPAPCMHARELRAAVLAVGNGPEQVAAYIRKEIAPGDGMPARGLTRVSGDGSGSPHILVHNHGSPKGRPQEMSAAALIDFCRVSPCEVLWSRCVRS